MFCWGYGTGSGGSAGWLVGGWLVAGWLFIYSKHSI